MRRGTRFTGSKTPDTIPRYCTGRSRRLDTGDDGVVGAGGIGLSLRRRRARDDRIRCHIPRCVSHESLREWKDGALMTRRNEISNGKEEDEDDPPVRPSKGTIHTSPIRTQKRIKNTPIDVLPPLNKKYLV